MSWSAVWMVVALVAMIAGACGYAGIFRELWKGRFAGAFDAALGVAGGVVLLIALVAGTRSERAPQLAAELHVATWSTPQGATPVEKVVAARLRRDMADCLAKVRPGLGIYNGPFESIDSQANAARLRAGEEGCAEGLVASYAIATPDVAVSVAATLQRMGVALPKDLRGLTADSAALAVLVDRAK